MSGSSQNPQSTPLRPRDSPRGLFSSEIIDLIAPPLKVGGWAGTAGVLAGVGGSIFKETNPIVWGAVSGLQWFTLGSSFWFTRSVTIRAWGGEDKVSLSDKTKASAMAGTVAGAMGGLIRGPKNIVPAMLCWTVFGAGGQMVANRMSLRDPKGEDEKGGWITRLSPLKKLTDQEYREMMSEKMLRIEVDIALIDDRIAELRIAEQQGKDEVSSSASSS